MGERPHKVRLVPPRLFARCGLACGTARLARRGWAGENRGLFEHPHPAKGEIYRLLERTGISFPSVED